MNSNLNLNLTLDQARHICAYFFDEIMSRVNSAITYLEVMQASMMEPHEEAKVWDAWDRQDEQQAYDDKFAMYWNEY